MELPLDIILDIVQKGNLQPIELNKFAKKQIKKDLPFPITIYPDLKFTRRIRFKHRILVMEILLSNLVYLKSGFKEIFIKFEWLDKKTNFSKVANYTSQMDRQKLNRIIKSKGFEIKG